MKEQRVRVEIWTTALKARFQDEPTSKAKIIWLNDLHRTGQRFTKNPMLSADICAKPPNIAQDHSKMRLKKRT